MLNRVEIKLDLVPVHRHLLQAQRISNAVELLARLVLRPEHYLVPGDWRIPEVVPADVVANFIVLQVLADNRWVVLLGLLVDEDDV